VIIKLTKRPSDQDYKYNIGSLEAEVNDFFAAIDLGSHTVRTLIARVFKEKGIIEPIEHHRDFTRFALTTSQQDNVLNLNAESLQQVRKILSNYNSHFKRLGVKKVLCGATGIIRKAQNGRTFLADIEKDLGFSYFIASEKEEAFWSTVGALQILNAVRKTTNAPDLLSKRVVFFDLGGSSTEVVCIDQGNITWWESYPIGAASLTKNYIPSAPSKSEWIEEARKFAEKVFCEAQSHIASLSPDLIVGGGGTVATLGAIRIEMIDYVPYRVCGIELDRSWIEELLWHLSALPLEERRSIPGLEKGREDVIIGGIVIVSVLMDLSAQSRLVVTDAGFLEGVMAKAVIEEASGRGNPMWLPASGQTDRSAPTLALTWKIEKS
jgi:exopolyphosphatase/guanosine-5'-triphosphate,3'-diphosphate pyrophosphatase